MTRIKRPLFGGAIQAFIPDKAFDARYRTNSISIYERYV